MRLCRIGGLFVKPVLWPWRQIHSNPLQPLPLDSHLDKTPLNARQALKGGTRQVDNAAIADEFTVRTPIGDRDENAVYAAGGGSSGNPDLGAQRVKPGSGR